MYLSLGFPVCGEVLRDGCVTHNMIPKDFCPWVRICRPHDPYPLASTATIPGIPIYSFILQSIPEDLLCASHCCRHCRIHHAGNYRGPKLGRHHPLPTAGCISFGVSLTSIHLNSHTPATGSPRPQLFSPKVDAPSQ